MPTNRWPNLFGPYKVELSRCSNFLLWYSQFFSCWCPQGTKKSKKTFLQRVFHSWTSANCGETFCRTKTNLSGVHSQFFQTTPFPSIPKSYICVAVGVSVLFPVASLSCSYKPMMKAGEDKDCPRCTDNHNSFSMKLPFQIFSQHIFCNSIEFLVKQLPWQLTLHPLDSVNKNSLVCTWRRKCQWWKWTCCHLFTHS